MVVITANGEIKEHITGITATPPLVLTGDVLSITTPLAAQYGGTGINNGLASLTLGAPINIDETGASDTNVLTYNAGAGKWVPSAAGSGTVGGSGTAPKIPKWTAGTTLGDSILSETVSGATITLTQGVVTSGSPNALVVVGGAHTTLTASVEAIDVNVNLARTVQWDTGDITTQRAVVFQAPTYAFVAGSTITTAATVAITDAPIQGANASLAMSLAFWVQSGRTLLAGTVGIGGTPSSAVQLWITQAVATSGAPTAVRVDGGAHTTLAASTETIDVNFNLVRTVQFAQGALATQRAVVFQAPTYAFATGASTLTTAATVAITGAPIAGANASITHSLALSVESGRVMFGTSASVFGVGFTVAQTVTANSGQAISIHNLSTLTAAANSDGLQGMRLVFVYAKGAFTGLSAMGINIIGPTASGAGTIATYAALMMAEVTIATANVGILVGTHPGGSTNYAVYVNSANASVFVGGINLGNTTLTKYLESTWTPTWTNLTTAGTPTYAGRYTQIGRIVYWEVEITAGGANTTASAAGSTRINNMPIALAQGATCAAWDGSTGASYGVGGGRPGTGAIAMFTPTWAATNSTIIISGWYEV